jgi:hypothetical protein
MLVACGALEERFMDTPKYKYDSISYIMPLPSGQHDLITQHVLCTNR